ncbi:YwqJ-related putative deaminase [Streptomyces sp. TP-A0874]|uniref:YwqJ-related putative deaminase n=1 Tax=Streptomyces sp. TP-A0874 TaxID=549819 RepID=UPI000853976E|nr:YwqJ-related putative deaminase [Streptomyces sp. TP-A0874]
MRNTAEQVGEATPGDVPRQDGGGVPDVTAGDPGPPVLRHRRDGILPAVGAALSVGGETLTATAGRTDRPPELHPLVREFLDALPTEQRERSLGRCPEAVLLSRYLTTVDRARGKRAARRPLSPADARRALRNAKLTARHIREDGDPRHGGYAPPCRSCEPLLRHFGVRPVDPAEPTPRGA